jgi:DNA-binding transcriptional ArsR family regulator
MVDIHAGGPADPPGSDAQESQILFALANTTRRRLLARLAHTDGQRLYALCSDFDMTRQAALKHVTLLAECGLVTFRRSGRETRVFLNLAPIRMVHRNFFAQFTRP